MTTVTGPSFELIRAAFTTVSGEPASDGAWTTFLCPAHDDNQASAAIKYDPHQHKTVVRCFAGCPDEAVLDSLGLSVEDLFGPAVRTGRHHTPTLRDRRPQVRKLPVRRKRRSLGKQLGWPVEVAHYLYHDIDGMRIGRVIRTLTEYERGTKKGFYIRRYEPSTDTWPLGAFEPVLYRLPQVAAAITTGQTIWLCEGEKDTDRAAGLGLTATCNALGAGSFTPAQAQQLTGAGQVVIVADRDRAGYAHARTVRSLLRPLVGQVVVLEARDGKDFSDHLDAGHTLEELEPCLELSETDIDLANLIESPAPAVADPERADTTDTQLQRLLACATSPTGPLAPIPAAPGRSTWWGGPSAGLGARTDVGAEP